MQFMFHKSNDYRWTMQNSPTTSTADVTKNFTALKKLVNQYTEYNSREICNEWIRNTIERLSLKSTRFSNYHLITTFR